MSPIGDDDTATIGTSVPVFGKSTWPQNKLLHARKALCMRHGWFVISKHILVIGNHSPQTTHMSAETLRR